MVRHRDFRAKESHVEALDLTLTCSIMLGFISLHLSFLCCKTGLIKNAYLLRCCVHQMSENTCLEPCIACNECYLTVSELKSTKHSLVSGLKITIKDAQGNIWLAPDSLEAQRKSMTHGIQPLHL